MQLRKFVLGALAAVAFSAGAAQAQVVVSSKIDTEGGVLGNIISQVLQANNVPVTERIQLGGTPVVREAITQGQIDIYPEYTGNAAFFFNVADQPIWNDAQQGYAEAKKLDYDSNKIVWLTPSPANNTWAIAVRKELADANNLRELAGRAPGVPGDLRLHNEAGAAGDALGW
jgi:osmoprotectant transport system substrate-binding protein